MTVEEIFAELSSHMVQGLMIHDQMSSYYYFLNLKGYAKCHEYHYWSESANYLKLKKHYFKHHNKLIKEKDFADPGVIPKSWYAYERKDVDATTKRNAVKTGFEKWIEWEKATITLYEKMYKELFALGLMCDADFVMCLIHDTCCELTDAESGYINKKTLDFEIGPILAEQEPKVKKYKEKIGNGCW